MQKNINDIHKHENVVKTKAKVAEVGNKVATWGMGLKNKWAARRNKGEPAGDDAPANIESREDIENQARK